MLRYEGGRICFATKEGAFVPVRPAGTLTKHVRHLLHGVTRLYRGVRYSLFVVDVNNGLGDKDVFSLRAGDKRFVSILASLAAELVVAGKEGESSCGCAGDFCTVVDRGVYCGECLALHTGVYDLAVGEKYNGHPFWRRRLVTGEPEEARRARGSAGEGPWTRRMRIVSRGDGGEWGFIWDDPETEGGSYMGDDSDYAAATPDQLPHQLEWRRLIVTTVRGDHPAHAHGLQLAPPTALLASLREFTYAELEAATSGFNDSSMISSEGAFGSVFRGLIGASQHIAVKVMRTVTAVGKEQYDRELAALQQCRHENLLPLLGCSSDGPAPCIVYGFKERGSLRGMLDSAEGRSTLAWQRRLCLLLDVVSGVECVCCTPFPFVTNGVKASRILRLDVCVHVPACRVATALCA